MKRTPLAVAAVCLVTAACSTGGGTDNPSSAQPVNSNVNLVLGVSGSPFYEAMACGAKAKASELGLDLDVSAGNQFSADAQLPVVNSVTAQRPGVAVVVPTDAQALTAPLQQMAQAGTKVITADQTLADTSFLATQILTDNIAGGEMAAKEVANLIGEDGKVLVITQPPGSTAQDQRVEGFEKRLKQYPGIDYLGAQYQSDDPQKAAQIVTSTLSAHPDLKAVFATNDQGAIGAVTGLQQADAVGKVKLVAYDAATTEVSALKNGSIQALIAQDPNLEGSVAMETAQKLLDGKPVPKETETPLILIRAGENAKADKYAYQGDC